MARQKQAARWGLWVRWTWRDLRGRWLLVTHNREISRVADRVIELSSGHIVADGPPAGGRAAVRDLHW